MKYYVYISSFGGTIGTITNFSPWDELLEEICLFIFGEQNREIQTPPYAPEMAVMCRPRKAVTSEGIGSTITSALFFIPL